MKENVNETALNEHERGSFIYELSIQAHQPLRINYKGLQVP